MSDDIVREFLVESNENLDLLDRELVLLEKDPQDKNTLSSVFRTIHTIKGTCGFLGFSKLESVAHVGENLLSKLREGVMQLNPEITTALLKLVDAIREMLESIEETAAEGERDDSALIETLTELHRGGEKPTPPSPPDAPAQAVFAEERPEAVVQVPSIGAILIEKGAASERDIASAIAIQKQGDPRHLGEILVEQGTVKSHELVEALQTQQAARSMAGESSIRVDVSLLDKVMNLVGELVLTRNQLLQLSSTLKHAGLHKTSQRLNSITTELQAGVMKTRMQPIENVWNKFPRTVRDVATACGKQVRIEMEGKDTELDKSIIEAIKDPLTHLVRNSVDHGIELPAARKAAGKSPEGCVTLRAYHEGGHVNIEISDDGAGLDRARIRAKAVQRGLVTADQGAQMSEREAVNLIFAPGFSTTEKVTNVSGRGVGMDVVKTNLEKIGGTVDVQTKPGAGTSIKMKIPLTLAIVPALIVTCAGDRYAIPQVSLLELVRIDKQTRATAIEYVHGAPVYRSRGRLLPLVYLDQALRLQREAQADAVTAATNIIVLQADERVFGLVVDRVNDTEEIVVKPLDKIVKGIAAFAAATIMGDGSVALILDVRGIARAANILGEARNAMKAEIETAVGAKNEETQTLLLVRLASGGHAAIPLAMIERLEEFPPKALEKIGAMQVIQYRQMAMPLRGLDALLGERRSRARVRGAASKIPMKSISVVVCGEPSSQIGLMVDRILDVVNEPSTTRGASTRHGVLGTQIIRERVTEILDLSNILRSARQHMQRAPDPIEMGA